MVATTNGTNGNGAVQATADEVMRLPTIEELKRAYEEGIEQTLLSGIKVVMRPVQPDVLLAEGNVPDVLTPLLMSMMFPPAPKDDYVFPDEEDSPVTAYLTKERKDTKAAMEFVQSVNLVCKAALVDPSVVPYLSIADRMWIFRLAWMPVAVLSTFRLQPQTDVASGDSGGTEPQQAEPDAAVAGATE